MDLQVTIQKKKLSPLLCDGAAFAVSCLLYAVFFGCVCSMSNLSTVGIPALIPGALFPLAILLARRSRTVLIAVVVGAVLLFLGILLLHPSAVNGWKVLLNRLYTASETRQSYRYDRFMVSDANVRAVGKALFPMGMLAGCWFSQVFFSRPEKALLLFPPLFLLMAYLAVTPSEFWLAAAAIVLPLPFLLSAWDRAMPGRTWILAASIVTVAVVVLAFPGKHETLSAWENHARDRLALQSVYYGRPEESNEETKDASSGEQRPIQSLDAEEEAETDGTSPRITAILIFAILILIVLFLPAVLSDRLKKRRSRNRSGLSDPDPCVRTKALFLYAIRWLRLAGRLTENKPFSAQESSLLHEDPDFGREFSQILPIWREAAYSTHGITPVQLAQMERFCVLAQAFSKDRMSRRQRFSAKYLEGL